MSLDKLKGKKFKSAHLNKLGDEIIFIAEKEYENMTYTAYGDCCSNSWIEHLDNVPSDFTVIDTEEKEVEEEASKEHECLKKYFYEIKTDKGSFTIEMRNSSNGYYGGWLELSKGG